MARTWPTIAVADVPKSFRWYMTLLDAQENHPGATDFNQILKDSTVLLCLHHWGPSGPKGDHMWPSLADPGEGRVGNGLLLWFVVSDFDVAWQRAKTLNAAVVEAPNTNNGTGMPAFVVGDPDGYFVAVNEGPWSVAVVRWGRRDDSNDTVGCKRLTQSSWSQCSLGLPSMAP